MLCREGRLFYFAVIRKMFAPEVDQFAPEVSQFAPEVDQESLKEEFEDLQHMENDITTMETDGQPHHRHEDGWPALSSRRYLGRRPEPEDCHRRRQVCLLGKSHGAPTQPATQQREL